MAKEENKDAQVEEETRALREAMSFVIGRKFPLPKNWSGGDIENLEFPNDLSMLTSDQLGELLGVWSTVMAYAQFEVARADITKTAKGNKYEFERKKQYVKMVAEGGMSDEQRKAVIYVDNAQIRADYEIAKARYTLLAALLNVYSKYYQALSRELSRRGLDGAKPPIEDDIDMDGIVAHGKEQLTKEWLSEEDM